MSLDTDMRSVAGGRAARILAVLLTSVGLGLAAAPTWGSTPSTDLGVTLENKADAVPGKRVTYQVTVTNKGTATANRVQIDFTTTAALSGVTYSIRNGHCYRSAKETACLFWSSLKPGESAQVSISGVMPKPMKKGTPVVNRVTAQSSTKLTNTADDQATDNYQIGVPRIVPIANSSPTVNAQSKILQITDTASHWLGYSKQALQLTIMVLSAAAVWFAIGLYVRHRQRLARGDHGDD